MIYRYLKYKDIYDFVKFDTQINRDEKEYSIIFRCKGLSDDDMTITNKCFGCLFCVFGNISLINKVFKNFTNEDLNAKTENFLNGEIIRPLNAGNLLGNHYKNLEHFTSVAETKNIQPWVTGILQNTSSKECRTSMEINVPNALFDRDGRIDVAAITQDFLLVLETKVSLEDALKDERFLLQFDKYLSEIKEACRIRSVPYELLLMIGNKETDLLPPDHPLCSGRVGGLTSRFYNLVDEYNIKFISATALWGLALTYITFGNRFSWDLIIPSIFKNANVCGLISAGKIVNNNGIYSIQSYKIEGT